MSVIPVPCALSPCLSAESCDAPCNNIGARRALSHNYFEVNLALNFQNSSERNCGQRAVSIITGIHVEVICQFLNKLKHTSSEDISGALRWFGWDCMIFEKYQRAVNFQNLPKLGILVCSAGRNLHAMAFFDKVVYDSSCGKFDLTPENMRKLKYVIKQCLKIEMPI